jgi:signal transduction histidine kinase/CHASE3 domain sensor protein
MSADRSTKLLFAGTALLLLLVLMLTQRNLQRQERENQAIRRTHLALRELEQVISTVKDIESAYRGHLLTYDTAFLEPYHHVRENLIPHIHTLRSLVNGDEQRQRVDSLNVIVEERLDLVENVLGARRYSGPGIDPILRELLFTSKQKMDLIRGLHVRLARGEEDALERQLAKEARMGTLTPLMLLLVGVIGLLITALLFRNLYITAQRAAQAEERLKKKVRELDREAREREFADRTISRILESSISAIIALRAVRNDRGAISDFEWILANTRAGELLSKPVDELTGTRLLDVMPPPLGSDLFEAYCWVVEDGEPLHLEKHCSSDGFEHWLGITAVRLLDGMVLTLTDISERKQQDELVKEGERLAVTGKLSRILAHEVRNPLTNLKLAQEQLADEIREQLPDHAEMDFYLDIMARNAGRIGQLVTTMLDSSRQRDLHLEVVSVNDLLRSTVALVSDRLELIEVRLEVEVDDDLEPITVDKEKMSLALLNLCVNAVEAMEPGQGMLRLRARMDHGRLVVEVQDNGKGIPAEELGKMFDPFYTGRKGGMGLGLTTSRSILHAHSVHLEVRSVPGAGTTITLRFPATRRSIKNESGE